MAEGWAPLAGIRVLDLADSRAELAGRMLAEFGAEVLKIEPPGGVDSRQQAPVGRLPSGEHGSLYWYAVGRGKHSAVIDLETEAGRQTARDLARRADILLESAPPGRMDGLGLGYAELSELNPRLVYVSVTPFGQRGPKARWPATELTIEAASGRLGLQGDRDRPPIPIGFPQVAFQAGALAAADAVVALNERELSGRGQHLDLSMAEAMTWTLMNGPGYPPSMGVNPPGGGDDRGTWESPLRAPFFGLSRCADGWVLATLTSREQFLRAICASIVPALIHDGLLAGELAVYDWERWDQCRAAGSLDEAQMAAAAIVVVAFFASRTRRELFFWAVELDIHLAPANPPRDLPNALPLDGRDFWAVEGEGEGVLRVPRPPVVTASGRVPMPAPAQPLDAGRTRIDDWRAAPPLRAHSPSAADRAGEAFAGVKIADFSWVAAGPLTAKAFADHGATVVRIESATRVDFARTLPPFKDGVPGINRSHWPNNLNTSKLGVALNLALAEGRAIGKKLIDWADVVIENYTPGTMARWGFDYATLSRERPDLVMLSTCLIGQTGSLASYAGYGTHGAALAGFYAVTGWPGRAPTGPNGPYTDVIAPRYAVAALGAALLERRRTGRGQYLDVSQLECAIQFVAPLALDQGGGPGEAAGLDSDRACPHGAYATRGTERYVAIAIETAEQWQALLRVAPLGRFGGEEYATYAGRLAAKAAIDTALAEWAAGYDHRDLERLLVDAGVPASAVLRMTDLYEDPQLASRGYFVTLEQSEIGAMPYEGLATQFSAKRTVLHNAAPCVGEDTAYVMRELLGMGDEEIAALAERGVFT